MRRIAFVLVLVPSLALAQSAAQIVNIPNDVEQEPARCGVRASLRVLPNYTLKGPYSLGEPGKPPMLVIAESVTLKGPITIDVCDNKMFVKEMN